MRTALVAILMLVLMTSCAMADFEFIPGTFWGTEPQADSHMAWTYNAWTTTTLWTPEGEKSPRASLYSEFDDNYHLLIASYRIGTVDAIVRADDRLVRVGVKAPIFDTGWSARFLTGALPNRIDVWTKDYPVFKTGNFSTALSGWLRQQDGNKSDPWVGIAFKYGKLLMIPYYNLRTNEFDSFYAEYPLARF